MTQASYLQPQEAIKKKSTINRVMGLFSWLFGSKNKETESNINLNGGATFSAQIVGESYYQQNLKKICGDYSEDGVDKIVMAKLIHDDNNPYDNKAISIEISGYTVGHLSKSAARYFRKKMIDHGYGGLTVTCKARIRGGWKRGENDLGLFGVVLDLPNEFIEDIEIARADEKNETDLKEPNCISFHSDKTNFAELAECKIGDHIKFWTPDDEPNKMLIFRRGSVGGGNIGYVPKEYSHIIASHIIKELGYEAEIIELDTEKRRCKIKCKLTSQEETAARIASVGESLRLELQKKYTPKKPFLFKIELPKDHRLQEGQPLYLEQRKIEYYVQNPEPLKIHFLDKHGRMVAQKKSEPHLIRRILKAYFNDHRMNFKIWAIKTPDKYTLPYIDSITATVKVVFNSTHKI